MMLFAQYVPMSPWKRLTRYLWWLFVVPSKYKKYIPPWPLRLSEREMAIGMQRAESLDNQMRRVDRILADD